MKKQRQTTPAKLTRTTFRTSRLLDFCSRKELIAQTGHQPNEWPLVVLKELVDNSIDACEDAGISPEITVRVDEERIQVSDNGPGISPDTIDGVLDFSVRTSSREAYVSPTRGAQGNALKTVVAMPYVLDGQLGKVSIQSRGYRHEIRLSVDRIRQEPTIDLRRDTSNVTSGTVVTVWWPDSARINDADEASDSLQDDDDLPVRAFASIVGIYPDSARIELTDVKHEFLQLAAGFAFVNPHLCLIVDWFGECIQHMSTALDWQKWLPNNPTDIHWYDIAHFERIVSAYIAHDADRKQDRSVRQFVSEFRGLSGTAKQKAILAETGMARQNLSALANSHDLRKDAVADLLRAMKARTKPVKPAALGVIGQEHIRKRFQERGCEMESFDYRKIAGVNDENGVPFVIETAFAWCPEASSRTLVTGVNWSPGIVNPFRELGRFGESLDTILAKQRVGRGDPVVFLLHVAYPRVEYADRGKSAVVVEE